MWRKIGIEKLRERSVNVWKIESDERNWSRRWRENVTWESWVVNGAAKLKMVLSVF
jgi:hypothetical protein